MATATGGTSTALGDGDGTGMGDAEAAADATGAGLLPPEPLATAAAIVDPPITTIAPVTAKATIVSLDRRLLT